LENADQLPALNAPLTPPECDLRKFPFMPLDVARLRDSDLVMLSTPDEFRAAVLLWCASWHQVPAGSLPDNDRALAQLAGYGVALKEWQAAREGSMRGWVKCSDGRLYHPVVCEKAREAFARLAVTESVRTSNAERQARWRAEHSRLTAELRARGVKPPKGANNEQLQELLNAVCNGLVTVIEDLNNRYGWVIPTGNNALGNGEIMAKRRTRTGTRTEEKQNGVEYPADPSLIAAEWTPPEWVGARLAMAAVPRELAADKSVIAQFIAHHRGKLTDATDAKFGELFIGWCLREHRGGKTPRKHATASPNYERPKGGREFK
jgi:hypothetical protein